MASADHPAIVHPAIVNTPSPGKTGAILLAAGFSRRFGGIKLQASLPDGSTILQRSFSNILQAIDNIIIVGREDLLSHGVYDFLHTQPGVQLVMCDDAASGMAHSLVCAVKQIPNDWKSVLVCLGDMPFIQTDTLRAIIAAGAESKIVIPVWQSQRGHPVSFGRDYFAELAASEGDTGGRHVIKKYKHNVHELKSNDQGIVQDIDTPEALTLLIAGNAGN